MHPSIVFYCRLIYLFFPYIHMSLHLNFISFYKYMVHFEIGPVHLQEDQTNYVLAYVDFQKVFNNRPNAHLKSFKILKLFRILIKLSRNLTQLQFCPKELFALLNISMFVQFLNAGTIRCLKLKLRHVS